MKVRIFTGVTLAVLLAGAAASLPSASTTSVSVLPTLQNAVVVENGSVEVTQDFKTYINVSARVALEVTGYQLRAVAVNEKGKTLGYVTARLDAHERRFSVPSQLVGPGVTFKVAVGEVFSQGRHWHADPKAIIAAAAEKALATSAIAGSWSQVGTLNNCGTNFCSSERSNCIAMCGDLCVQSFSCDRSTCSSSCTCKSTKACDPI